MDLIPCTLSAETADTYHADDIIMKMDNSYSTMSTHSEILIVMMLSPGC